MALLRGRRDYVFDTQQVHLEEAIRGRTARRIRGHLRRMDSVAMITPRWSSPQGFLEDMALDLAVDEPEIGCRTVSFRPLMGRSAPEAWNFLLRVLSELPGGDWGTRPVPMVCDRRGFFYAAEQLLESAHEQALYPVAMLAHGVEHLPVEILDDLAQVWTRYLDQTRTGRRCTLMLAGSVDTPALDVGGATRVELCDYGESEAAASLILKLGLVDPAVLDRAVRFSGGVPSLVEALGAGALERGELPRQPGELLRCMGPTAEDLRGAVEMALTSSGTADRFHMLLDGEARTEDPDMDRSLLMAGLVRRVRVTGAPQVMLRSPALAAISS